LGAVKRRFREDSIVLLRNVSSFIIRGTFLKLTRPTGEIKRQTREEKQAWREKRWYDARSLDIAGSKRLRNKIIEGRV